MKAYLVTYKFYYDNELQSCHCSTQLRDAPYEEEYSGTDFDGLWDLIYKWAAMTPFNLWEFKKGKRFIQHYDWWFKKITSENCKPWKFVITSEETTISMQELMHFKTETVIQYLKERGITTCPILK
jgi:hypothetical protein